MCHLVSWSSKLTLEFNYFRRVPLQEQRYTRPSSNLGDVLLQPTTQTWIIAVCKTKPNLSCLFLQRKTLLLTWVGLEQIDLVCKAEVNAVWRIFCTQKNTLHFIVGFVQHLFYILLPRSAGGLGGEGWGVRGGYRV